MPIPKPTITVAIPSFNKERYIDRCLKSILQNKKYIDEIILVDNASTDRTFELAKKYEPEIKCYLNSKNLGMSGNWNRCIDLCQTDWLMIFHADDEMVQDVMEKYIQFIIDHPSVALIHAGSFTEVEGGERRKEISVGSKQQLWKAGIEALNCPYGACSTVMVKKEVYERLGYFIDKSLSSDAEMWARIASKYDVGYMDMETVVYHVNPSSTGLDSLTKRSLKEICEDWELLSQRIADAQPSIEMKEKYLQDSFKMAPYTYWSVVKANLRARNYVKVLQTVKMIIFKYRGLVPLIKISFQSLKKYLKKYLKIFN